MNILYRPLFSLAVILLALFFAGSEQTQEDMAKQSQNPMGTIISMPFEFNSYFGIGPSDATAYGLTLKPVYPFYPVDLGNWNLINRFIVPTIYSEGQDEDVILDSSVDVGNGSITGMLTDSAFGLADINRSL